MLSNPFDMRSSLREVERLRREVNRLFEEADRGPRLAVAGGYPAMNVWANADGVVVTAELPGIKLDDLDIAVQGNTLTLQGVREPEQLEEGDRYHRRERPSGRFQRVFQLPYEIEVDKVEATYEAGVLRLLLPRAEADKPRKIEVRAV